MSVRIQICCNEMPGFTLEDAIKYVSSFSPGEFGCLLLCHDNGTLLNLMINGHQAYPHFFPSGDHPGWQIAAPEGSDWRTEVEFRLDDVEPTPMPLAVVVSVER